MPALPTLLAFDTATERMSLALQAHGQQWSHDEEGGARASAALIPAIRTLLSRASLSLQDVDAIAFGRGPGAFTGLRTACAVAQGLAFGLNKPVLPVDTLLTVAQAVRDTDEPHDAWVVADARMDEIYAAQYAWDGQRWRTLAAPMLARPEDLHARWAADPPRRVAGSALAVFGERLLVGSARLWPDAAPSALAMLPLAQALWADGGAVDAALALPLYVRDKVAQTTAEREALREPGP